MSLPEPTPTAFLNPAARYFAATRPGFLLVTAVAVLLGLATAAADGVRLIPLTALVTLLFALVTHAGVNVINDYYDALNGSDSVNTQRRFPFTGGSRFIQNGVLSLRTTALFGCALLASVIPAGLWLIQFAGSSLIGFGVAGLALGWAYSAPPVALMSRGLGEMAVVCGWLLIVAGSDLVQRGAPALLPWIAGMSYALQLANVLIINQFPDVVADASAGKRNLVVRLGPRRARWLYPAVTLAAAAWLTVAVFADALPNAALAALMSLLPSALAGRDLLYYAESPHRLDRAIRATIGAALLHGLLLAAALTYSGTGLST